MTEKTNVTRSFIQLNDFERFFFFFVSFLSFEFVTWLAKIYYSCGAQRPIHLRHALDAEK